MLKKRGKKIKKNATQKATLMIMDPTQKNQKIKHDSKECEHFIETRAKVGRLTMIHDPSTAVFLDLFTTVDHLENFRYVADHLNFLLFFAHKRVSRPF